MSTPETQVINFNWSLLNEAAMMKKLHAMSAKGWHLVFLIIATPVVYVLTKFLIHKWHLKNRRAQNG